jgi:hypothetical protein
MDAWVDLGHWVHTSVFKQPEHAGSRTVSLVAHFLSFTAHITHNNRASYPDDNCAAAFPQAGFGNIKDPQTVFPNYLNHTSGILLVGPYINSTGVAQAAGKPFLMFETNTASCGGFPGVSDSFGAALWAVDYGFTMAASNFSGALLHVGGQSTTYNVSCSVVAWIRVLADGCL